MAKGVAGLEERKRTSARRPVDETRPSRKDTNTAATSPELKDRLHEGHGDRDPEDPEDPETLRTPRGPRTLRILAWGTLRTLGDLEDLDQGHTVKAHASQAGSVEDDKTESSPEFSCWSGSSRFLWDMKGFTIQNPQQVRIVVAPHQPSGF
ncbi:hypothetical protein EYF80_050078 [Liparis tanakae]|uniref:Uncharacterized protein n=1 Tax=Liparis tanakae TaxID=230148 RepID=A0A4Z2FET0_9TELE|nr:hypothetical protein EYF80_050078 [Liparis tanakae]